MTIAPGTGCFSSSRARTASAGGQLEHPSDVKSSTTTGTDAAEEAEGLSSARAFAQDASRRSAAGARRMRGITSNTDDGFARGLDAVPQECHIFGHSHEGP